MYKKIKQVFHFLFVKHSRKTLVGFALMLIAYWFCLPRLLFKDPYSLVLEDRTGELLGARIAEDGQWRFPAGDSIPQKFVAAIVEFEDRRFFKHPGIDPVGIGRAIQQNWKAGEVVSGGSTISMQTIRLARKPPSRSLYQKLVEMIMATRMELTYSKDEILSLYAAHAPFGGNVVGLEAASWRYFSKGPHLLSWSEAAMLAVLPNSPALIHPGRNRETLRAKRNRLLDRLEEKGLIDSLTCTLAKEETLPERPIPLPRLAPHLLDRAYLDQKIKPDQNQARLKSTLQKGLQIQVNDLVRSRQSFSSRNEIHNLAAIVIEVETGEILSYVGNVIGAGEQHDEQVNNIPARRSTGSILKPLLYALMLQEGQIVPNSLIPDVPSQMGAYRPENFNEEYDGVVSAQKALIRSLNIPLVHMLQTYGLEKFHHELQQMGLRSIDKSPDHYGLPLILGGAESSLMEISSVYTSMARTLNHAYQWDGAYAKSDFRSAHYVLKPLVNEDEIIVQTEVPRLSTSAIWFALEAMQQLERPNSEGEWEYFQSSQQIAWKTGTSFGFRDAWAVGINPRYVVGVWAGNSNGEGRPGLVGVKAAAPLLFDIFNRLPSGEWFDPPYDEMMQLPICRSSGYRSTPNCPIDTIWVPNAAVNMKACSYHPLIHLDSTQQWQVSTLCENPLDILHRPWFLLPPLEEYYYKSKNPSYFPLPPWRSDCQNSEDELAGRSMQLIYPKYPTKIYVPIDLDGKLSRTVFQLAHRNPETRVHWHIDQEYMGSTTTFHSFEFAPEKGVHLLSLVDAHGNRLEQSFEIIGKEK